MIGSIVLNYDRPNPKRRQTRLKRIILADLHLSGYKDDNIQEDGLPYRLSNLINILNNICLFAKEDNIKYIDIAGDIHNDKDIIYTDAQNAFIHLLEKFSDLQFTLISGNHDMSNSGDYQTSAIQALGGYSNVMCLFKPTIIDNITFIPYSKDIVKWVNESDPNKILISHFGVNEAQLQSGISIISDVSFKNLLKFNLVLLGHYHKPQELFKDNTKLFYVGNPMHFNWNDKNEVKRFLVYDTESLLVESFNISGFVQYREFVIDENTKDIKSILDEAVKLKNEGHHVRVRKFISEPLKYEKDQEDLIVINENSKQHKDRGINMTMTQKEIYDSYLTYKDIPKEEHKDYLDNLEEALL